MSPYLKHIFPVNMYHGTVENNAAIKEQILPLIEKYGNKHNITPEGWLTNHLKTSFDDEDFNKMMLDKNSDVGKVLLKQYINVLENFFDRNFSVEITDMWYNLYSDGEYQEAHNHCGDALAPTHFACVHFLSFNPKIHSPLTFIDPMDTLRHLSINMKTEEYCDRHNPRVKEGSLVMFPAYLKHEVKSYPSHPDEPRITVSFNITVTEYAGLDDEDDD